MKRSSSIPPPLRPPARRGALRRLAASPLALIALLLFTQPGALAGITVYAGEGIADGAPAARIWLPYPDPIAADGQGDLYFYDSISRRIWKASVGGTVSSVAGGGTIGLPTNGLPTNGLPANRAALDTVGGLAADAHGNVFFTQSNTIWKASPDGRLHLLAGIVNGRGSYDATPAENQPATTVRLDGALYGLAVDGGGDLFFSESNARRVRKIDSRGRITTVAGFLNFGQAPHAVNPTSGLGDGGPATKAYLRSPRGLAVDAQGDLFIADAPLHRVRKVGPDGLITTVAGTGIAGFSGDGGPAGKAQLDTPYGVAVDPSGGLWISDSRNRRIRRVDPNGVITTVAGTGARGFAGNGGPAAAAALASPRGIAADGNGGLFVADSGNHQIRKIAADGTIAAAVGVPDRALAGEGGPALVAALANPTDLATDRSGNLYIADEQNHRIARISPEGVFTTIAGGGAPADGIGDGGLARDAALLLPRGVALDAAGSLYIADAGHYRVRRVAPDGTIATVAGSGAAPDEPLSGVPAIQAILRTPCQVAVDAAGDLFIADTDENLIRKVSPSGVVTTVAGTGAVGFAGDGGPAVDALLNRPQGIAVDSAGSLIIADTNNARLRAVDRNGVIRTVATFGAANPLGGFGPSDVAADASGSLFALAGGSVEKIAPSGGVTMLVGPAGPAAGPPPARGHMAVDRAGNLFVAGSADGKIMKIAPGGAVTNVPNGVGSQIDGIAVDSVGNLYITAFAGTDPDTQKSLGYVYRVAPGGATLRIAGSAGIDPGGDGGPALNASLSLNSDDALTGAVNSGGVAVDSSGFVYVADTQNDRVRKIAPDGTISTVAGGPPGVAGEGGPAVQAPIVPSSVAMSPSGELYVLDGWSGRVRKVTAAGTLVTVAGGGVDPGVSGPIGDGGPATRAVLKEAVKIRFDAGGNLFIREWNGFNVNRARRVGADGTITTVAQPALFWDAFDSTGNRYFIDPRRSIDRVFRETAPSVPALGDVDGDGRVDIYDVMLALRAALGIAPLSGSAAAAADLNGDGRITLEDVVLILKRVVGVGS